MMTDPAATPDTLPDTAPVIRIQGLHKSYGAVAVLKGVSMTAPRGEPHGLAGAAAAWSAASCRIPSSACCPAATAG